MTIDIRTVGELLGRQLGLPPVAAGYLDTGKAQLADGSTGHKTSLCVDEETVAVGNRPSYWNIMEPLARLYPVEEDVVRTLGWSVAVDNDNMVAIHVMQPLAAHIDEAYGQVVERIKH